MGAAADGRGRDGEDRGKAVEEGSPTSSSSVIEVTGLSMTYGSGDSEVRAIERIDLSVRQGEFLSIVGPSGCGKTTLLMCVAGLRRPTTGTISLHGLEVTEPIPGLSIVFQDYSRSLFPWYTNSANVVLALWDVKVGKAEREQRVHDALDAVGLADVGHLYPWQLSGGMQQRVAIARALVTQPEVLLMDEPFASVDAQTRVALEDLLLDVWRATGVTIVFVTHDIDEGVYLSDRIAVLSDRPSRVLRELEVTLGRPRDQLATRANPRFADARSEVFKLIMKTKPDPD